MGCLDADEIVPGLWQGSLPPTGDLVFSAGFRKLVLCAREYQLPSDDFPGVHVVHAPNDDHHHKPLTREKLQIALDAAHEVAVSVREGSRVLVTCAAGLNRSGLVTALSLHLLFGWAGVQCIAMVRKRRPQSKVHPGKGSLYNNDFVNAISRLGPKTPELQPLLESKFVLGPSSLWLPR